MRIMVAMLLGARTSKEERNGTEEPKFALYGTGDPREEAFPRKGKWKKNEYIRLSILFSPPFSCSKVTPWILPVPFGEKMEKKTKALVFSPDGVRLLFLRWRDLRKKW